MKKIVVNIKYLFFLPICLLTLTVNAQNPAAGKPQTKPIALTGGTIHIGTGQVIEKGVIVFDKGIITLVGDAATSFDKNATEVIDATGKHIFPGSIALSSTIGLQEISAVRATVDAAEIGEMNPNVRALIAYSTDSEVIPTLRSSGVLIAQAAPQGGTISGISSVFNTDGWNWEDAVLKKDDGMWVNWPPFLFRSFNMEDLSTSAKRNERRQPVINQLRQYFTEAKAYAEIANPMPVNLRLAAAKGLFTGTSNLYVKASYAKDILEAVKFGQEMGIKKIVISGGGEAYKVLDFLKENNIPVILEETQRMPEHPDENVYLPYELPGILQKAGVKVAISYDRAWWRVRNLNYQAGMASGFSDVSKEDALKFITLNAAEILGIDKYVGSLEKGKQATLIIAKGDVLDMRTNVVEQAFIKGSKVNLDDKHKRLYEKYKEKYGK